MDSKKRLYIFFLGILGFISICQAQSFHLFSDAVKNEYPSIVYTFLENYLYKLDNIQRSGKNINQKLQDDKVLFVKGNLSKVSEITDTTSFRINKTNNKYYDVIWFDNNDKAILDIAFPMQYELLLGKAKNEIEKDFKYEIKQISQKYKPISFDKREIVWSNDVYASAKPANTYYNESLSSATYYLKDKDNIIQPVYSNEDKFHSAANLMQGCFNLDSIHGYNIYIEQNIYGFKKLSYTIPLYKWITYCQSMQLETYFALEEERIDGLKILIISKSNDLGFNHMMSIIIPDDFITNKNATFKGVLNAYIPTQNVKDLFQKYKAKDRISL